MRFAYLLPPVLLLAACGQDEKAKTGPEISINAGDEHGGVQISSSKDGGGKVKIGGDGVDIDIDVPDFVDFDVTGDFDIDGVKLYPGSQVTSVNVDATDRNGADRAVVNRVTGLFVDAPIQSSTAPPRYRMVSTPTSMHKPLTKAARAILPTVSACGLAAAATTLR